MKQYVNIIMIVVIIILSLLLIRGCQNTKNLKNENQRIVNNIEALNDTIREYKNNNGEKSFEKKMSVMTKDELKIYNKSLYDKIVNEDGKVKTIIETRVIFVDTGSAITKIAQLDSNKYSAIFDYNSLDSVITIKGHSIFYADIKNDSLNKPKIKITPYRTFLDETKVKFDLTIGIKETTDDKITVFVTPSSKNITISKLNGTEIYIPKKKDKKFSLNVSIGYGATLHEGKLNASPAIIFGLGYNFLSF